MSAAAAPGRPGDGVIGERGPGWGADWGEAGEIPADAATASNDAAAGEIVADARRANRPIPAVVLTGGDLARTLGVAQAGVGEAAAASAGTRVVVDVGAALIDGRLHWFVAHLVARRSWWRGRLLVAANASFIDRWNAAPRSHPGDGRLDVFDASPAAVGAPRGPPPPALGHPRSASRHHPAPHRGSPIRLRPGPGRLPGTVAAWPGPEPSACGWSPAPWRSGFLPEPKGTAPRRSQPIRPCS